MVKVTRLESAPEAPAVPGKAPAPFAFETCTPMYRESAVPLVVTAILCVVPVVGMVVKVPVVAPSSKVSVAECVKPGAVKETVAVVAVKPDHVGVSW